MIMKINQQRISEAEKLINAKFNFITFDDLLTYINKVIHKEVTLIDVLTQSVSKRNGEISALTAKYVPTASLFWLSFDLKIPAEISISHNVEVGRLVIHITDKKITVNSVGAAVDYVAFPDFYKSLETKLQYLLKQSTDE